MTIIKAMGGAAEAAPFQSHFGSGSVSKLTHYRKEPD
jgi:hypothetical protein